MGFTLIIPSDRQHSTAAVLGYPGTHGRMWLKLHLGPVESRQDVLKLRSWWWCPIPPIHLHHPVWFPFSIHLHCSPHPEQSRWHQPPSELQLEAGMGQSVLASGSGELPPGLSAAPTSPGIKGMAVVIDSLVIHCNSLDPNEFIWYSLAVTHSFVSLQL